MKTWDKKWDCRNENSSSISWLHAQLIKVTRYFREKETMKLLYILESNPHPNLIRTSFCRFLKRKKKLVRGFNPHLSFNRPLRAAPSEVARWVSAAWKAIPESIIVRSFKKCRISNSLDQWRTQDFFSGGGSTNSVEDRVQRGRGSGGGSPLVRGSGGSCNLVQEVAAHTVKFS